MRAMTIRTPSTETLFDEDIRLPGITQPLSDLVGDVLNQAWLTWSFFCRYMYHRDNDCASLDTCAYLVDVW